MSPRAKVRVPGESPGEVIGKGAAQVHWRETSAHWRFNNSEIATKK